MAFKQIDCFNNNMKCWKFLGVWPAKDIFPHYKQYSSGFVIIFVLLYELLTTINFFFIPRRLDSFIDEMIFYFTLISICSKALTIYLRGDRIMYILKILETDNFQPDTEYGLKILDSAKKFNTTYWKIVAGFSYASHLTHILTPLIVHFIFKVELELPVCSYSFLPDNIIKTFIYPLYFYQAFGMNCHVLFNLNVDTFLLGTLVLLIAQLDILNYNLQNVTENTSPEHSNSNKGVRLRLNNLLVHFEEVASSCDFVHGTFSETLFVQFSMASCIICVCLFRFTLPAPFSYYVFLANYMVVMVVQILMPCWLGTRIINKSSLLSTAIYSSDWTSQSKRYKSSLGIFVERVKRPLSLVGGKMFPLSLQTFTSIVKSAYSFFTLLRNIQARRN